MRIVWLTKHQGSFYDNPLRLFILYQSNTRTSILMFHIRDSFTASRYLTVPRLMISIPTWGNLIFLPSITSCNILSKSCTYFPIPPGTLTLMIINNRAICHHQDSEYVSCCDTWLKVECFTLASAVN